MINSNPSRNTRLAILGRVLLTVAALLLAGCGNGATAGQTTATNLNMKEFEALAEAVLIPQENETFCQELITVQLRDEIYGNAEHCAAARAYQIERADDPRFEGGALPEHVTVNDVQVDDGTAKVSVREEGGSLSGTEGNLLFVKEGKVWKVNAFNVDYARSRIGKMFDFLIETVFNLDEDTATAFTDYRSCVDQEIEETDDTTVLDALYADISARSEEDDTNEPLNAIGAACEDTLRPGSPL